VSDRIVLLWADEFRHFPREAESQVSPLFTEWRLMVGPSKGFWFALVPEGGVYLAPKLAVQRVRKLLGLPQVSNMHHNGFYDEAAPDHPLLRAALTERVRFDGGHDWFDCSYETSSFRLHRFGSTGCIEVLRSKCS
jgi:hypothetical protein